MSDASLSVGFIMDGNRRWAKAQGRPTVEGHRAGRDTLMKVLEWSQARNIPSLIFYAFSTENWKRSHDEVTYLLDLFRMGINELAKEVDSKNVKIRFVGDLDRFPDDLHNQMTELEAKTANNAKGTIAWAVSYGGRAELVAACNALKNSDKPITEADVASALWTHDIPDPDIIIRTGGQQRLSNFLTWQSVYSELFFTDTLWPDFSQAEFTNILSEFSERKRNYGK